MCTGFSSTICDCRVINFSGCKILSEVEDDIEIEIHGKSYKLTREDNDDDDTLSTIQILNRDWFYIVENGRLVFSS